MAKGSIQPTRVGRSAANLFVFLAAVVMATALYAWFVSGSLAGLIFGAVFSVALLLIAGLSRRAGTNQVEQYYDAASHGDKLDARELDEQLGTPPPPTDRGIRPGRIGF